METKPPFTPAEITVILQPEEKSFAMPRPKSALQLLRKLNIRPGTALVIRDQSLLTPDREILPNDVITVRIVTSSG